MGLIFPNEQPDLDGERISDWIVGRERPRECFYCNGPLDWQVPVVYWTGGKRGALVLHIDCASEWGTHLIGDARLAKETRYAGEGLIHAYQWLADQLHRDPTEHLQAQYLARHQEVQRLMERIKQQRQDQS